jgi:hypothetical protein
MKELNKRAALACALLAVFAWTLDVAAQPGVPNPILSLTSAVYLPFSNLTADASYQLQVSESGLIFSQYYDEDLNALFQAAINDPNNYILYQEGYFATYQDYTNYIMTADGAQLTAQATNNATASYNASWTDVPFNVTALDTNYVVNSPAVINGSLYRLEDISTMTNTAAVFATAGIGLSSTNLSPLANYQIQFKPFLGAAWQNLVGGQFSATDVTNLQILPATNNAAFFRLQYLP